MAFSPDDDTVLASDGAGALTVASLAGGVRTNTADAACALTSSDYVVLLSTTGAGTRAITNASLADGQRVWIRMTAQSTGTYEMETVIGSGGSGTLTFNAVNEAAEIVYDGTNVCVISLSGATVV
jgi:hypothetical protein